MPDFDNMSPEEIEAYVNEQVKTYIRSLDSLVRSGQIESYNVNEIQTYWSSWSLWKKLAWAFCELTGYRQYRLNKYKTTVRKIHERNFKDGIEAVDALNAYEKRHFKEWFLDHPKIALTIDVTFKPIKPADKVEIKENVNGASTNLSD